MKTPSTDLFQLIQSMSKHEKRHFKLMARTFKSEQKAIYLQLFDAISSQDVYDEARLRAEFADRLNANRFSVAKHYLYQQVLESLNMLHYPQSIFRRISRVLEYVEVLFTRELYAQAEKELRKAGKLLRDHPYPDLYLRFLVWEYQIQKTTHFMGLQAPAFQQFLGQFDAARERLQDQLDLMVRYMEYRFYRAKDGYIRSSESFREQSQTLVMSPPFRQAPEGLPPGAATLYYHVWGIHHFVQGEFQESLEVYQSLLDLMQDHPNLVWESPHLLSGVLFDLGAVVLHVGDPPLLEKVISRLEEMRSSGLRQEARIFFYLTLLKIRATLDGFSFAHAQLDIEAVLAEATRLQGRLGKVELFGIYFHLALLAFYRGDFSLALQLVQLIINDKDLHLVPDAYLITRLVRLVIHLELKNYDLIEDVSRNVYRYIAGKDPKFKLEAVLAKTFSRLLSLPDRGQRKAFLEGLRKQLQVLRNDPALGRLGNYFDFEGWIESQLQGKPLLEIVQARVRGKA